MTQTIRTPQRDAFPDKGSGSDNTKQPGATRKQVSRALSPSHEGARPNWRQDCGDQPVIQGESYINYPADEITEQTLPPNMAPAAPTRTEAIIVSLHGSREAPYHVRPEEHLFVKRAAGCYLVVPSGARLTIGWGQFCHITLQGNAEAVIQDEDGQPNWVRRDEGEEERYTTQ